jgi:hypothetical protein
MSLEPHGRLSRLGSLRYRVFERLDAWRSQGGLSSAYSSPDPFVLCLPVTLDLRAWGGEPMGCFPLSTGASGFKASLRPLGIMLKATEPTFSSPYEMS